MRLRKLRKLTCIPITEYIPHSLFRVLVIGCCGPGQMPPTALLGSLASGVRSVWDGDHEDLGTAITQSFHTHIPSLLSPQGIPSGPHSLPGSSDLPEHRKAGHAMLPSPSLLCHTEGLSLGGDSASPERPALSALCAFAQAALFPESPSSLCLFMPGEALCTLQDLVQRSQAPSSNSRPPSQSFFPLNFHVALCLLFIIFPL